MLDNLLKSHENVNYFGETTNNHSLIPDRYNKDSYCKHTLIKSFKERIEYTEFKLGNYYL